MIIYDCLFFWKYNPSPLASFELLFFLFCQLFNLKCPQKLTTLFLCTGLDITISKGGCKYDMAENCVNRIFQWHKTTPAKTVSSPEKKMLLYINIFLNFLPLLQDVQRNYLFILQGWYMRNWDWECSCCCYLYWFGLVIEYNFLFWWFGLLFFNFF